METLRESITIETEYQTVAYETDYGYQKQTSDLVGGHIMQTLPLETAKFVKKHRDKPTYRQT